MVVAVAHGVWKRYARSSGWLLREVDLTLPAGALTVILGRNGSGKSTLLRIVAGAAVPTRGHVRRPPRSVSYQPEVPPPELRFTPDSYLRHLARLRGRQAGPALARSRLVLERLQLTGDPDQPISRFSKGNRQKVMLAQALGFPADLTVLDEPFSGLDDRAATELVALLAEARAEGRSVLVSAHQAASLADADAFHQLESGRLQVTTPPAEPAARPLLRIALRANAPTASTDVLARAPGVRSVEDDPLTGQAIVLTSEADPLLRSALAAGWSFVHGAPPAVDADEAGPAVARDRLR